jgi:GTPase-associated system helical domain
MTAQFDFVQSYRDLDESASRDVVEARQKSFQKLSAAIDKMNQIYDLCRLAYQIEPLGAVPWFEDAVREFDPHFIASKDKIDAGRIAALLLRQRMMSPGSYGPLAVLTTSYCGRRHSADGDLLTTQANDAFTAAVHGHKVSKGIELTAAPKFKAITAEVDAVSAHNPVPGNIAKAAFDATMASGEAGMKALFENVKGPITSARSDIVRLAEEVDMLWWCIGDWHELLDKPRTETAAGLKMVISGIELGAMVRQLPGPYGAHGILRRISGAEADAKSTLKAAIESLSQEDAQKLAIEIPIESKPLLPIHAAVHSVAHFGPAAWEKEFAKIVPDIAAAKMSPFELGIQAFRERALLGHGGLV